MMAIRCLSWRMVFAVQKIAAISVVMVVALVYVVVGARVPCGKTAEGIDFRESTGLLHPHPGPDPGFAPVPASFFEVAIDLKW